MRKVAPGPNEPQLSQFHPLSTSSVGRDDEYSEYSAYPSSSSSSSSSFRCLNMGAYVGTYFLDTRRGCSADMVDFINLSLLYDFLYTSVYEI